MTSSAEGVLTTHTGSLPRPSELAELMVARETGTANEESLARLPGLIRDATQQVVARQGEIGIDVGSDGEQGKIGYATYVKERMSGFDGEAGALSLADLDDYPEITAQALDGLVTATPSCTGPVRYTGGEDLAQELKELRAAVDSAGDGAPSEVVVTAASPGVIAIYLADQHYGSHEAYLGALAEAMRTEYEAIVAAGFVLQIDCPDLAMGRHAQYADATVAEFRRAIAGHIEALNAATAGIDPDRMRMHLCWGNYESPHHRDVDLGDIVDIVMTGRPRGVLMEAANPRHAHEWQVFEDYSLPADKILVPGVIDTCSNYIEHPQLVAERIVRYARSVGIERVIAGTDCGFSTFASFLPVHPRIAWAKLASLVEGARLATEQLRSPRRPAHAVELSA
ncbi:cobalamin-independent methionine synthase II family protein [Pseudonocardia tropica]|jgi:5-methyltetrahydropteroyltriglutamate--homocysteine methyltransferase|uniref:5-methyltetrahydropteroyltriglutamate--homocysteine methyltransferase n=2 Tax=Pseudonocardia TaxID=1847 RepID=A0ABS4W5M8_9PSEU|nr:MULTISPECIES: cobalamin-independent methionine synthase II family protein [Pseudonocardia]MBP2371510.1 5-methyltetrahydropteroyltriglutamate--homocysteine methyltransferase [Pseudonocardia parietis]OLM09217.1 Methionine synthase II (Cobalamin-independent) [Pseudonocardia sp. Ae707_Ps1]